MTLNYKELSNLDRYKIMSQSVIPRPIAWIVTKENGVINLAPFSYFTPLSSDPATIIVSIGHKEKNIPKDTLHNIRKTKKATICFVNSQNLEKMNQSATPLDKNISEIEEFNIEIEEIEKEYPPIIKNTNSAMFCDFYKEVEMEGSTIPIILEIKSQYFDKNSIDSELNISLDNIARVGKSYAKSKEI